MGTYSVYIHISPSNKKYIGITKNDPLWRWRNGSAYARCALFSRAIKKYGWKAFQHGVIAQGLTQKEAENMEVALIEFHKSCDPKYGYNVSLGGHIAYPNPSEEFKEKLRLANTGANNHKSIRVRCVETGEEYESIHLAAKALGLRPGNILRVLIGRNKTTGGYSFEVVDEKDKKEKIVTKSREQVAELFRKKVAVYSMDGALLDICSCGREAADKYGTTSARVSNCIRGHRKSANGYMFVELKEEATLWVPPHKDLAGASNPASKSIDCYSVSGEFIKHYPYASLAKEELGLDLSSIIKVCRGRLKQHKGYIFKYAEKTVAS